MWLSYRKPKKISQETLEALYPLLPKGRRETLKSWGSDISCKEYVWLSSIIITSNDGQNQMHIKVKTDDDQGISRVIWDTDHTVKTDDDIGWGHSYYYMSFEKFKAIFDLLYEFF